MKRHLVLATLIMLSLLGSACASKQDVSHITRRVENLEEHVQGTYAEISTVQEDIRDQDLRLQFLEYEAVQRGDPIAPRRSMSTPDPTVSPTLDANGGRVVYPEAIKPVTQPPAQAKPAQPAPTATAEAPKPAAPANGLPASPTSTASPQSVPGSLPAPVEPVSEASENSATDVPRGSESVTQPPQNAQPGVAGTAPAPQGETLVASRGPAQSEQRAYDAALQLYRTGRFPQAEAGFQAFLEVYPDSGLVPNALYWKGETYYARNMFADAIFAFKDVQTRFPENQKTPDSLLKTAMAYQKLGDTANASLHLAVLYEDWPNAEATLRAKRMGLRP